MNQIIQEVVSAYYHNIETPWDSLTVNFSIISLFIQVKGSLEFEGESKSFNADVDTKSGDSSSIKIKELREHMYNLDPKKGPWYSMSIKIYKDGSFKLNYNYEDKPNFTYEPSKEKYIQDLKDFPRSEEFIPVWLSAILNA